MKGFHHPQDDGSGICSVCGKKVSDKRTHVEFTTREIPALPKEAIALGEILAIEYRSSRDGKSYRHEFDSHRPLLASSLDGAQLVIVGGRYRVTERGIE